MNERKFRPVVMSVTVVLFVAMLAAIVANAELFYDVLNNLVMNNMMWGLGWATSLIMLTMIIILVVIMFTPLGKIRLGGPNAKPKFSYMQWFGISLCTGIGAGVVFWGAAEPLLFAMEPAPTAGVEPGSAAAVVWSMSRCFLEWGFMPYSSCVVMGAILAYVILNKGAPFKASSLLVPIFGMDVTKSRWADAFDAISAFALTGAVAGGLGYGAMQLSSAVNAFAGIAPSIGVYIGIIAVMFVCYNLSAVSGLRNGITMLSNRNTQLFFILLLFVFLTGPTAYICNLFTESFGVHISNFFGDALFTAAQDATHWPQNWDMYWWVDWMAYAPLLGLFMVRVSYGRTLREFVIVEWVAPAMFGIIWFSVFGGTILNAQINNGVDFYTIYLEQGAEALTLSLFNVLPLSTIAKIVMLLIITVSLVTQCDSMAVTLAGMCYTDANADHEPPVWLKLFWGTVFAVIAVVFIALGGIAGVKTIKSLCGIPLTFICMAMAAGWLRYMSKRPRKVNGEYEYEEFIADAPDNGEPEAKKSKILGKFGF